MKRGLFGIVLALAFAGAALALKFAQHHQMISADFATRAFQAAIGLVLAAYGNLMPKSEPECGDVWSARKQALLRTGGWLFTIAGLGYAVIWLAVPMERASDLSMALVGSATAITLVYTLWVAVTSRRRPS